MTSIAKIVSRLGGAVKKTNLLQHKLRQNSVNFSFKNTGILPGSKLLFIYPLVHFQIPTQGIFPILLLKLLINESIMDCGDIGASSVIKKVLIQTSHFQKHYKKNWFVYLGLQCFFFILGNNGIFLKNYFQIYLEKLMMRSFLVQNRRQEMEENFVIQFLGSISI